MQSKSDVTLAVQIVHWNRPHDCARTVSAFCTQGTPVLIRVIDNASTAESFESLRSLLPSAVEIVRLSENKGWGGAHNEGLRRWLAGSGSEFCALAAHDALPQPGCLIALASALRADGRLGIVCPQYEEGSVGVFSPVRGPRVLKTMPGPAGAAQCVDIAHGTLMLVRRACIEKIGGFDKRYFAYGDEYDLAIRARRAGWRVGLVWGATVVNPGTSVSRPVITYLSTRSSLLLAHKHGGWPLAIIRAGLILLNSVRLSLLPSSQRTGGFHRRARSAAVRDFLLGRFGAPPAFHEEEASASK